MEGEPKREGEGSRAARNLVKKIKKKEQKYKERRKNELTREKGKKRGPSEKGAQHNRKIEETWSTEIDHRRKTGIGAGGQ